MAGKYFRQPLVSPLVMSPVHFDDHNDSTRSHAAITSQLSRTSDDISNYNHHETVEPYFLREETSDNDSLEVKQYVLWYDVTGKLSTSVGKK